MEGTYLRAARTSSHQLKEITIKTNATKTGASNIRVLKTGLCLSLSGKSKLTFEVGGDQASEIHVRISKNSGSGWFSKDWVALAEVGGLIKKNADKPITFSTLLPIFEGRSVNTAGFLLAVLKHEGLVRPTPDSPRSYERADPKPFFAEIARLMDSTAAKGALPNAAAPAPSKTTKPKAATPEKAKAAKPAAAKR